MKKIKFYILYFQLKHLKYYFIFTDKIKIKQKKIKKKTKNYNKKHQN